MIEEDADSEETIADLLKDLDLGSQHTQYIGRSSSLAMIRTAMALKTAYDTTARANSSGVPGTSEPKVHGRTPEYWDATSVSNVPFSVDWRT